MTMTAMTGNTIDTLPAPTSREHFLDAIQQYCELNDISGTVFGAMVVGDPTFVSGLRRGRNPSLDRIVKVYKFIFEGGAAHGSD
jgi:hypothetical protein